MDKNVLDNVRAMLEQKFSNFIKSRLAGSVSQNVWKMLDSIM